MHVHVDFFQRYFDEKQGHWINPMRQDRAVPFGECTANQTIAHEAAVDEKKLCIARSASLTWSGDKALNLSDLRQREAGFRRFADCVVNFQQAIQELRAKNLISALAQVLRRRHTQRLASIIRQGESDFRMSQRVVRDEIR